MELSKMNDPDESNDQKDVSVPIDSHESLGANLTLSYVPKHRPNITDPQALILFRLDKLLDYYKWYDQQIDDGHHPTFDEYLYSPE